MKIITVLVLALMLTVSCRRGGEVPVDTACTETKPAVTESTTELTESTAVTATTQPSVSAASEICAIFNRRVGLLFAERSQDDYVDAEKMLDVMLPYLLGDDSPVPAEQSYHLSNVAVTGEAIAMPREVFYVDGVMTLEYEDPEYGPYREMEVCHENGTVYLSTYDGMTTVDDFTLTDQSALLGDLSAETMELVEEQLRESNRGVYMLSNRYARGILNAIFSADIVSSWADESMVCLLDISRLEDQDTIVLTLAVNDPAAIRLELRLDGIGGKRESTELTLAVGEEVSIRLACGTVDGSITEMHMTARSGELISEVTQSVSGTHTDLTMVTKSGNTVELSCQMALDMLSATDGRGTVEAVFRADEKQSGGIAMLSSSAETGAESVSRGEFSVRMESGEVAMMELAVSAEAGTVMSEVDMKQVRSGAAVGESVMYYAMRVHDRADPAVSSTVEMDVKLTSLSPVSSQYAMSISVGGAEGSSSVKADITAPADARPSHTAREQELIGRSRLFLTNCERYLSEAESTLNSMVRSVTPEMVESFPPSFYVRDADGDGIVILVHLVNDNGYYVYADVLLDFENYTYFYDLYDTSFHRMERAAIWTDGERIQQLMNEKTGYQIKDSGNAIGCYYREEQDVYVLVEAESGQITYLWEKPRSEDFPGYTLHQVKLGQGGTPIDEIHSFTSVYDASCYETLVCGECGLRMTGILPDHDIETVQVICEMSGRQPHTALADCARCHNTKRLVLTDSKGAEIHFELANATPEVLSQMESYREGEKLHASIERGRNAATHYVIFDMHLFGSAFEADVIIPDLRGVTGDTILGIGKLSGTDGYAIPRKFTMNLVLPEGMEFVIGGFLEQTVFSSVAALTLPSTMVHVDDVLSRSPIEELVIPASVKVIMGVDWVLPSVKRLIVEADFDVLPEIEAPLLEELQLLGSYREITGFRYACMLDELIIPEGVKTLGHAAFMGQTRLTRVVLPESLTELSMECFSDCTSLKEVILPSSLTYISGSAFDGAENLLQITLPASVTRIESGAFRDCFRLREVKVEGELSYVAADAFQNCNALSAVPKASVSK